MMRRNQKQCGSTNLCSTPECSQINVHWICWLFSAFIQHFWQSLPLSEKKKASKKKNSCIKAEFKPWKRWTMVVCVEMLHWSSGVENRKFPGSGFYCQVHISTCTYFEKSELTKICIYLHGKKNIWKHFMNQLSMFGMFRRDVRF